MKRSVREIIELAVFGLIALLIGTGLLWVTGWVLAGLGWLMQIVAGLLWSLLRFIVPVAIVAGLVYLLIRWVQQNAQNRKPPQVEAEPAEAAAAAPAAGGTADSWHTPVAAGPPAAAIPDAVTESAAASQAETVVVEAEAGPEQLTASESDEPQVEAAEVQAEVQAEADADSSAGEDVAADADSREDA